MGSDAQDAAAHAAVTAHAGALTMITAELDARKASAALRALAGDQFAFAVSLATNRLGQRVKKAEQMEMVRVFDRPTPYVLNALQLTPGNKAKPEAKVWFRAFGGMPAERYLGPQVFGGVRIHKRLEKHLHRAGLLPRGHFLVPARGAPLDSYGNVKRSEYAKILAQLQAAHDPHQRESAKSRKRQLRSMGVRYVWLGGASGGRGVTGAASAGIFMTKGGGGGVLTPVFRAVSSVKYRKRFAFFELANQVIDRAFGAELERAVTDALDSAK